MYFGAFSLPATVLGWGERVGDLVCPISSSMAVLLTPGEDGHVHSTNNNSNHATSAFCVKVETGFPAPFNLKAAKSLHTPHSTTT